MEDQKTLDWKQYEYITKYIYETLGGANINIVGYGSTCKVKGESGVTHQIDVLTSVTDDTSTFQTAIECKYLNKKVDKETVMKLLGILVDTHIQRGIIVSKSGYTPDAQKYAKHYNILIVQLREAGKEYPEQQRELHLFDLVTNVQIHRRRPALTTIIAKDLDDNEFTLHEKDEYQIIIENRNGETRRLFDEIMLFRNYLQEQEPEITVIKEYVYPQSLLHFQNNKYKIKSITYTGLLTVHNSNQKNIFSIVDRVWMLLEKIFEQQTFVVTEGGIIVDTTAEKDN